MFRIENLGSAASDVCTSRRRATTSALFIACVSGGVLWAAPARALRGGIQSVDCSTCHRGGTTPTVNLTADVMRPNPGETITLTIQVSGGSVFGFYLSADEFAEFQSTGGSVSVVNEGATHSAPITTGSIQVRWRVPDQPGGVVFDVAAVAANANNTPLGDGAGTAQLNLVWGCDGEVVYRDADGDGVGSADYGTKMGCGESPGWATVDGDCNDANPDTRPNAPEFCNDKDDDCDGEVDEETSPVEVYLDEDGDGFGVPDVTELSCEPPPGFAGNPDDCLDRDPSVNPSGVETCNGLDDNCNGDVDEGVRPRCGVGWCERIASGCSEESCLPGEPRTETCNGFDDDCDGQIDNGDLCPAGQVCVGFQCTPEAQVITPQPATPAPGGPSPSATSAQPPEPTSATVGASGQSEPHADTTTTSVAAGAHDQPSSSTATVATGGGPNEGSPPRLTDPSEEGCTLGASPRVRGHEAWPLIAFVWILRRRARTSVNPTA